MVGMVSVFAQMEREVTAERVRDNMHMLARSGRWLGGHTPTGFQSSKEERVDLEEATNALFNRLPGDSSDNKTVLPFIYDSKRDTNAHSFFKKSRIEKKAMQKLGREIL